MNQFNFFNGWKNWQVFIAMWVASFVWTNLNALIGAILLIVVALAAHQWYKTKSYHTGFDKIVWVLCLLNAVFCGILLVL